jgi:hypothetical protein
MIGTRSLQWGAVVMTTLNIQKAVVVTTLTKIYACMESGHRSRHRLSG